MQPVRAGDFAGSYIHYGIREHGMAAAMNGIALHGGFIPYGGTFLAFADYCRPAIRLAALMGMRVIYVMTHDSIGLGEDGPTHQPVEHLASLRAIPNLLVFRPADAVETAEAWDCALQAQDGPSRAVPVAPEPADVPRDARRRRTWSRAAPMCSSSRTGGRDVTLIATGSEVAIALEAREAARDATASAPRWSRCRASSCSSSRPRDYRAGGARHARRASASRPRSTAAGTAGSATTATSSA